jgi:hypothetical protein
MACAVYRRRRPADRLVQDAPEGLFFGERFGTAALDMRLVHCPGADAPGYCRPPRWGSRTKSLAFLGALGG